MKIITISHCTYDAADDTAHYVLLPQAEQAAQSKRH